MKRDMVSKPTGRPRGRPALPLQIDPERYWIALFYAGFRLRPPGASQREIALRWAALRYGVLALDARTTKLSYVYANADVRGVLGRQSESRRNSSAFHPRVDDLQRKLRRILTAGDLDDRTWLTSMTDAWECTFTGQSLEKSLDNASAYCMTVGELHFFERVLGPIIRHRFHGGPAPRFSVPDFISHDAS